MRPLHVVIGEAAARQGVSLASRRSALALAGVIATAPAVAGVETALAKVKAENRKGNKNKARKRQNEKARKNDIDVLNYALTLEHLEFAFYRDGLAQFDAGDFDDGVFARLLEIRDHEGDHVDAITGLIQDLGGDPVGECTYDFGNDFDDPDGFLGIAQALENTGVSAYDGAIASIRSGDLQTAGATIATVEARHASYLNVLNGDDPFPQSFDDPKTMEEILAIAGPFIVSGP